MKLLKIILPSVKQISPFNERARDLRIQNKPLWLIQRDVLSQFTQTELELNADQPLPETTEPCIVYRDNLYFDEEYLTEFLEQAVILDKPVQAAFRLQDSAFREHCLPLSNSYQRDGDLYLVELWFFPHGPHPDCEALVVDMDSRELGYYHVPTYMASTSGDLVYQVPRRALIAIDSWVHIFIADSVFGVFARGARFEDALNASPWYKLRIMGTAMMEGKQLLECSQLVKTGHDCNIDPTAIIHGPTTIGNHVTIGAGAVIENCIIGDNVNISQGCNLMLSVIGDGTFLPFRASLFMTTIMENSMVAQNTCLQLSVVGRNTFIGAGSTFTDFNLLPQELRARNGDGMLENANRPVLGGCVGHNCRIGAGMIIFPARTIESDVVLVSSSTRRVIDHDVTYDQSDHHQLTQAGMQKRIYPKSGDINLENW